MSQPIRVLQVIGSMNRGGAEAMIMNLYRKIDRSKIQFDFVVNTFEKCAFDDEIESLGGIIYHCPHFNGKNYIAYKKWWIDFFSKNSCHYKIIHGHIGSTASIYLKIAKNYGLYTIAHSHSSGTDHSFHHVLYKILSYNTRNIADFFFACSKEAGIDRFGERVVNSNKYMLLNNAIDTDHFNFNSNLRDEIRAQFNLTNEIVFGHIGRFSSEKNHFFILQIFKELVQINNNCKLILVGDGILKKQCIEMAQKLKISENVIFTGIRSDVHTLIQGMDYFIFPSLYEGLPVTLIEIQTSGLAGVISDKVPTGSILVKDLITVKKLENTPQEWANHIYQNLRYERKGRKSEITAMGYDISETAKWLGGFYLEKWNS